MPKHSRVRARKSTPAEWQFPAHFRRGCFGWKGSRLAIQRIKQAVGEITRAARRDPELGAEGAIRLIEKLSPALERVDSSSGALGNAVNAALEQLVPVISQAPAPIQVRERWLERLFEAHAADEMPYIEILADHWGELCGSRELASSWADRLLGITRMALSPDKSLRGHFHGTTACLSALLRAERHLELFELLRHEGFWAYKRWAVLALAAQGKADEAIALAEASRGPWTSEGDVNRLCEEILLSTGRAQEAYERYGLVAPRGGTYLSVFREVSRRYPLKQKAEILRDLIKTTPGEEGKWFATAKEIGEYELALVLADRSPCDPRTLTRAARDFSTSSPAFACGAGLAALKWLVRGYGHDLTALDIWSPYTWVLKAAEHLGLLAETRERIRQLVATEDAGGFVRRVLGRELRLD